MVKGSGALHNSHQIKLYLEVHSMHSNIHLNHLLDTKEQLFFSLCRKLRLGFHPMGRD